MPTREFPTQPLIQAVFNRMSNILHSTPNVDPTIVTRAALVGWVKAQQWKTFQDALASAGLTQQAADCVGGSKDPLIFQQCTKQFVDKVAQWAVPKCLTDIAGNMDKYEDVYRTGELPDDKREGTSTGTILAIAAGVVALGGIGMYAYSRAKKNPEINPKVRSGHFGGKSTKGIRSTVESDEVEAEVRQLAADRFPEAETIDLVYEHGQWWVVVFPHPDDPDGDTEATYSVVDTSSGLDLEAV